MLKTRIWNTCQKYNQINALYRYRQIIKNLSNNEKIKVLKQDKGRGVVIMDGSQYMKSTQTCCSLLKIIGYHFSYETAKVNYFKGDIYIDL